MKIERNVTDGIPGIVIFLDDKEAKMLRNLVNLGAKHRLVSARHQDFAEAFAVEIEPHID